MYHQDPYCNRFSLSRCILSFFFTLIIFNIIKLGILILKSNMKFNKICLNCGSSDLVSDRSLGGKMVCFKCGSSSFGRKSFSRIQNKKIIYFLIALIVLLLVIL